LLPSGNFLPRGNESGKNLPLPRSMSVRGRKALAQKEKKFSGRAIDACDQIRRRNF
jgi:hypothetical protein